MQLLPGAITVPALQRFEVHSSNLGLVTVVAPTTLIHSLPSMNVEVGDRIFVMVRVSTNALPAEVHLINLQRVSGSASIEWVDDAGSVGDGRRAHNADVLSWSLFGIARVTVRGTLVLGSYAYHAGVNYTINADAISMYAWGWRGVA